MRSPLAFLPELTVDFSINISSMQAISSSLLCQLSCNHAVMKQLLSSCSNLPWFIPLSPHWLLALHCERQKRTLKTLW